MEMPKKLVNLVPDCNPFTDYTHSLRAGRSSPRRGEIIRTRPERPRGPRGLLYTKYQNFHLEVKTFYTDCQ